MRTTTLAAFMLGAWLGATLFMWAVATQDFRIVDRLLASPAPEMGERVARLGAPDARLLMRHQASEVNRLFFDRWSWTQIGLGVVFLLLVLRSSSDRLLRVTAVLMLIIAATLQFAVVPETVRLGRLLDFAPRSPAPPEVARFWRLHAAYTTLDMLKFLLGVFGLVRLAAARR